MKLQSINSYQRRAVKAKTLTNKTSVTSSKSNNKKIQSTNSSKNIIATAKSGKDTLDITSGSENNTYVISFSDSTQVSRVIARGYITINGKELKLTDEVKQQLKKTNEQAESDRLKAYKNYVSSHEAAVAKQQSNALKNAYISNMSSSILKLLVQSKKSSIKSSNYNKALKAYSSLNNGVSWSQFEWKTYNTQMTVSLKDKISVEKIAIGENTIIKV